MSDFEYTSVLRELAKRGSHSKELLSILDSELSLPNIPFPTMGGEVFWNDIAEYNGWKIQQNMFTHHARILDDGNIRIAWGTLNGMLKALDRMVAALHKYEKSDDEVHTDKERAMHELRLLKELLDIGAITKDEFQSKKEALMKQI